MKKIISMSLGSLFLCGAASMAQDTIAPAGSAATTYASPPAPIAPAVGGQGAVTQGGVIVSGQPIVGGNPSTWGPPLNPGQTIYGGNPSTWGPPLNQIGPYYPQPSYPQPSFPQPSYPINMNGFQPQVYYPPYNPAVIQTPNQVQSVQYDQWGRVIVNTGSQTVFDSAFNAGRNQVVPGTLVNVNRYERDQYGNQVHVTGQEWTGLDGQPHANLNRNTVTSNNGVIVNNDNVQVYGAQATPPTSNSGGNQ